MDVKQNLKARVWAAVKSIKLAIILILAITAAVTVDILILANRWNVPVGGFSSQTGEVYRHRWFQALVLLLLVNLTACTTDSALRRARRGNKSFARWGSTVFHGGMIIILAGTLVSGNYRALSKINLVQGDTKQIPYEALTNRENSAKNDAEKFSLTLEKQRVATDEEGKVKEVYSFIRLAEKSGKTVEGEFAEQEKLSYRGIYIYPSLYSYAVRLTVTAPGGKTGKDLTLPMGTMDYEGGIKAYHRDSYRIAPLPYAFSFNFYPDLAGRQGSGGGSLINRSQVLGNPGLFVHVRDKEKSPVQKVIRPGEGVDAAGYRIVFKEAKPWLELTVVFDPGAKVVFAGTVVAIIGLTVLMLFSNPRVFDENSNDAA